MIRRGLLLFISSGLLSLLSGCHFYQGRCDCQVYPLDHGTASPFVHSSPPPVQPIASAPTP